MSGIFISYRRLDVPHAATLLHVLLSRRLPLEDIFIDVGGIQPGDDFVATLTDQLATCKVLLAVIGPKWLDARDSAGRRRLDQEDDYVRLELETALRRRLHIVPVLFDGAPAPKRTELPEALAPLARLNAISPTLDPLGDGIEPLGRKIERIVAPGIKGLIGRIVPRKPTGNTVYESPKRSVILDAARSLVQGSGLPSRVTRVFLPDLFLKQDINEVISLYPDEPIISAGLPYVEITNWCPDFAEGRQPEIEVRLKPLRFELSNWGMGDGDNIRDAGFEAFRAHKPRTFDGPAVRIDGYRISGRRLLLQAQHATYFTQVHSSLILDYRHRLPNGSVLGLRDLLRQEYGQLLPPLNDPRLANTLGVAALIFCSDDDGLTPYLVARTREVAVNDLGNEWHCTASGVAELREAGDDPSNFIELSIRKELEEEVGLVGDDLVTLAPIAFCRELMRGGKPQFFFLGVTRLPLSEITRKLKSARRRAKQLGDIVENTAMPMLRKPESFKDATPLFQGRTISAEAAACLHYFFKCFGDYR
ncbi:MAG: toll/interleukin-1 receptor domain-containing protein [Hyphomicrobiaceae bacterium]